MNIIEGLTINQAEYCLPSGKKGMIAVLIYSGESDPTKILDYAVSIYVQRNSFHELIDANLDNPWMRVIINDINDMSQEQFDIDKHRMNP